MKSNSGSQWREILVVAASVLLFVCATSFAGPESPRHVPTTAPLTPQLVKVDTNLQTQNFMSYTDGRQGTAASGRAEC